MEEQVQSVLETLGHPVAWGSLGQGTTLPRIMVLNVSGFGGMSIDGATGNQQGRIQVDCFGQDYPQALTVARSVRALLHGYSGGPVLLATLEAFRGGQDEAGGDVIQRVSLDFAVKYRA